MTKKRLTAYSILTFVSLLWGIASPVIKYTLNFIPPYSFLFWRFLITLIIFLPFFLFYLKKYPLHLNEVPVLAFLGFLGTPLTLILLFVGYTKTTSIDGVLISSTAPIFITIGGVIFLKEKVTFKEKIGLLIAVLGSLITISQPLLEGGFLKSQNLLGNILVFGSVLSWTAFTLLSKFYFRKHHPFVITAFCFFIGLITVIPLAFLETNSSTFNFSLLTFNLNALPGILYMSIFSSVIAYTLYEYGLSLIEASEATLFAYLQPIFAAPVALIWLDEKISFPFLLGALIIAVGIFISGFPQPKDKDLSKQ